jgi:arylsulfatase A-like enzyme
VNRWFALLAASIVIGGGSAVLWSQIGASRRPNVLIVLWDTARADRMSLYGYGKPTTPRLDAFAKGAVVYDNATAPGMWTLNTHAAMFTGLYESSHGAKPAYRWLDGRYHTVAELARDAGYDTFAYSSNLIASPLTNLTQGFDTVYTSFPQAGEGPGPYQQAARQATSAKLMPRDASTELSPSFAGSRKDDWKKSIYKDAAPVAHQALMDWLGARADGDRPFFAYLNLMEAHSPRVPSLSARKRVSERETIELALRTDNSLFAANEYIIGAREYTPEELGAIGATYDATLVDLDDATGDLLDDLAAKGILDDTLVIVVADHGEGLGEHRRLEHRWSMYDQLLHVPLVIRYPKGVRGGDPARISERVNTIDLFATIAEVADLEPPGTTFATSLVGRTTFDRFVFSQMLDPYASQLGKVREAHPDIDTSLWVRTYCVVYEGARKLLYRSDGVHELYDVSADPGELENLYPTGAPELEQALAAFEAELPAYDPSQRAPEDGPSGRSTEEQNLLAVLGYTEGDPENGESPLRDFCGPRAAIR